MNRLSKFVTVTAVLLLAMFAGAISVYAQSGAPGSAEAPPAPMVQFLNILLTTFVTVATPLIVAFVISLLRQLIAKAKASVSAEQWLLLQSLASAVVSAAEQSGLSKQIGDAGRTKKEWAIDELMRIAAEHGMAGLDLQTLSSLIESEVFRQLNQPVTPVPLISVPTTSKAS